MEVTAPISSIVLQGRGGGAGFGLAGNILGLVVLVIDILVIIAAWRSRKTLLVKIVWTIVILLTHVIGWILYFFLGREK